MPRAWWKDRHKCGGLQCGGRAWKQAGTSSQTSWALQRSGPGLHMGTRLGAALEGMGPRAPAAEAECSEMLTEAYQGHREGVANPQYLAPGWPGPTQSTQVRGVQTWAELGGRLLILQSSLLPGMTCTVS